MQTFGVRVVADFRKSKSGPWIGPTHLILLADMHRRRLEADLGAIVLAELGDELAVMGLDALEPFEEIDVKIGAAELAVGDSLQARRSPGHRTTSRMQSSSIACSSCAAIWPAAKRSRACSQPLRAQIAADMVGAKRRTGHVFLPRQRARLRLSPMLSRRARSWQPATSLQRKAKSVTAWRRRNFRSIAAASLSRTPP